MSSFPLSGSVQAKFPTIEQVFADLPNPLGPDVPTGTGAAFTMPVGVSLFSQDTSRAPYELWTMRSRYRWDEGIAMMPVSAPPSGIGGQNGIGVLPTPGDQNRQAASIVRLSSPSGLLAVYWAARRLKEMPVLPMPIINDNATFHTAEFEIGSPSVHADGTCIYEFFGVYYFFLKKPVWMLDGINPGASPAHTLQPSDNTIPASNFKKQF